VAGIHGRVGGFGWQSRLAGVAEGEFDVQRGAGAGWAAELEVAAECLGAVLEPDQAGAFAEVRAAAAVVADVHVQDADAFGHFNVGGGCISVLGGVREGFGDGVVGGDLDTLR
jgi:hypothetical protein